MTHPPMLDKDAVNALLQRAFPFADPSDLALAREVEAGRVLVVRPYAGEGSLRP
jgi:hypothetical protein